VCSGWRVGLPGCFCQHWYGWCRLFWSPARAPVTGISLEFQQSCVFKSQKGPSVLEVVFGCSLHFLVSVFSVVFFSPSGSGWFSSSPSAVAAVLGFLSPLSSVGSLLLSAGSCFQFLSYMPL